jgi:predicted ester cyclase
MTTPLSQFTRLIEEAFNGGDLSVLDDLVSADFVEHQFESPRHPARRVGPAGVARIVAELRRGAPDFHLAIEDSSVTGDTVWARLRGTGTDTGGQLGRPPTGRSFAITVIDVARFADDRMVEHWGVPDRLDLLLQIGLFDGPPRRTDRGGSPAPSPDTALETSSPRAG